MEFVPQIHRSFWWRLFQRHLISEVGEFVEQHYLLFVSGDYFGLAHSRGNIGKYSLRGSSGYGILMFVLFYQGKSPLHKPTIWDIFFFGSNMSSNDWLAVNVGGEKTFLGRFPVGLFGIGGIGYQTRQAPKWLLSELR